MPVAEKVFWLEAAEPAIRAEERLREGEVDPADVFKVAMAATGDEKEAAEWVSAYQRSDAKAAAARWHRQ